jgi:outer membrane immunogenic protein
MRKAILALVAGTAFTGSALAADMAVKSPRIAPPPPPVASFTGCWLSGGVGYGLYDQETTGFDTFNNFVAPGAQLTDTYSSGGRGWLGRVGAGCDYQFGFAGQQLVIGALGDYDWTNIRGRFNDRWDSGVGTETINNQWAIGGRVGWVALPNLLTFFSVGYTQAQFSGVTFTGVDSPNIGVLSGHVMDGATYHGWFIGGGDEYAFTSWGLPNLFWKTEYRVSEFNSQRVAVRYLPDPDLNFTYSNRKWVQTVTSSLVWRFNWFGAPVAAKY